MRIGARLSEWHLTPVPTALSPRLHAPYTLLEGIGRSRRRHFFEGKTCHLRLVPIECTTTDPVVHFLTILTNDSDRYRCLLRRNNEKNAVIHDIVRSFFVTLASPNLLSTQKNSNIFGFSFVFSYLCTQIEKKNH